MTEFERSAQFWAVLVQAARSQSVVSDEQLEQMTGIPRFGQGSILGNIYYYCQQNELPALTSIVIDKASGIPTSNDFIGLDISALVRHVFVFDWLSQGAPTVEDFERARAAEDEVTAATV